MKSIRFPVAALALAGAVALAGCELTPTEAPGALDGLHADHSGHVMNARPAGPPVLGAGDLALIRMGTAKYQRFEEALADGFIDPSGVNHCVAHPQLGGMGIHYVNFEQWGNVEIDPSRPEILLYEPTANGRMRLVGVEFAVPAAAWHAAGNNAPPSVAGVEYDPPVPGHESPIVSSSYTLHVWTWAQNPNGMFFPFNPRVSCD